MDCLAPSHLLSLQPEISSVRRKHRGDNLCLLQLYPPRSGPRARRRSRSASREPAAPRRRSLPAALGQRRARGGARTAARRPPPGRCAAAAAAAPPPPGICRGRAALFQVLRRENWPCASPTGVTPPQSNGSSPRLGPFVTYGKSRVPLLGKSPVHLTIHNIGTRDTAHSETGTQRVTGGAEPTAQRTSNLFHLTTGSTCFTDALTL
jgi:hypothetical protein